MRVCLNFVQGGGCHATGEKCLLGLGGACANNDDRECELQGRFDVWLTQKNELLITDLGFPAEEPKQCLALAVSERLANTIAGRRPKQWHSPIITSQRICSNCRTPYWTSDHESALGLQQAGQNYLCPNCIGDAASEVGLEKRLGSLRYWCG